MLFDSNGYPKLIDFSVSFGKLCKPERRFQKSGTVKSMAPEILQNKGAAYYSDYYSLGCLLHLMLTGRSPEYDNEVNANLKKIKERDVSFKGLRAAIHGVSDDCIMFLSELL